MVLFDHVVQILDLTNLDGRLALEHGLNTNMVSRWRRQYPPPSVSSEIQPTESFIAVHVAAPPAIASAVIIEHGELRVRFEGTPDPIALQTVLRLLRSGT
jgi:transposase